MSTERPALDQLGTRHGRLVTELCNVIHRGTLCGGSCGRPGPYGHEDEATIIADFLFDAGWCQRPDGRYVEPRQADQDEPTATGHRLLLDDVFLVFAFRYALGRMSAAPGAVADELIAQADRLEPWQRLQIVRDIDSAIEQGRAGMPCDIETWRGVRYAFAAMEQPKAASDG